MKKIKVGEYVRNDEGDIGKVKTVTSTGIIIEDERHIHFDSITKHRENVIDLIEAGDYVNGHLVIAVDREKIEVSIENCMYGSDYEDINGNIDIKSIVTKEQFNSIKYVIGE
jgi:hypothetical protein